MNSVSHTSLDGSQVVIRSRGLDLSLVASSHVAVNLGGGWRPGFTGGGRSLGASLAGLSRVEFGEEYSLQSGTLRIALGAGLTGDVCVAAWERGRCSITSTLYGSVTAADAIALFDRFILWETASGEASLIPKDPAGTPFIDAPVIYKEVPDLGLLIVAPLTREKARALPRWSGTPVDGGELFAADLMTSRMRFVLVSENAVTTIMPKHSVFDETRSLAEINALGVAWAR